METVTNTDQYLHFLQTQNRASLFTSLRSYLINTHYDQSLGDIVPSVICNALKVNLNIYNESQDHNCETINVSPWNVTPISIDIHRRSDHYNGILPCTTQTLLSKKATSNYYTSNIVIYVDPNSVKPDQKASRISYNNEQLLALQHSGFSIKCYLRKSLFHLRIW